MNAIRTAALLACLVMTLACATKNQVKLIVANSNALMVDRYVERVGGKDDEGWEGAVAQIDALIAANPDEKVLINHLRVRQAMLLTIHTQITLARMTWIWPCRPTRMLTTFLVLRWCSKSFGWGACGCTSPGTVTAWLSYSETAA